ncbi:MAG: hypothetical protein ACOX50_03255 [Patescibacteria group bacterium]
MPEQEPPKSDLPDFESIIKPPEYEVNCRNFVEEVAGAITPKFERDLDFYVLNYTEDQLNRQTATEEVLSEVSDFLDEELKAMFRRSAKRVSERADKQSAFFYEAVVDICAKRAGLEEQVKAAVVEVREAANRHHANEVYENSSVPLNTHLQILFGNR